MNKNFIPKLGFVLWGKCGSFMVRYGEAYVTLYLHKIKAVFIFLFVITPRIFQSNLIYP